MASMDLTFVRRLTKVPKSGFFTVGYKHTLDAVPRGQAECQWYPPRNRQRPKAVIMFFPGNPGLVEYYPPFLHKLQTLIPQSYGLLSLGHVGHSLTLSYQTQALTLAEQIAVKVEFVQKLGRELDAWATEEGGGKTLLGLMGHSVGAEMAVQTIWGVEESAVNTATEEQETENTALIATPRHIDAAFLLFPTLAHIARTPNAMRLRPLFHSPLMELAPLLLMLLKPVFLLVHLAWYLFPSLKDTQSGSIYSPNPITVTMLETPIIVSHVLRLARSEMETILEPDLEWYKRNGQAGSGRVFSYWGANDGWVGKEGDEVKRALRGEQESEEEKSTVERLIECKDNIPHAFCLAHSDAIAEKVADWVGHAFKQKRL